MKTSDMAIYTFVSLKIGSECLLFVNFLDVGFYCTEEQM